MTPRVSWSRRPSTRRRAEEIFIALNQIAPEGIRAVHRQENAYAKWNTRRNPNLFYPELLHEKEHERKGYIIDKLVVPVEE